jgi:hypothetical protein
MISTKTLLFGLQHTTDVGEAERLADMLGERVEKASTDVWLSPEWVTAHAKGSAIVARFAIGHCNDSATLDRIAAREKRVAVARKLSYNEFLSDEAYTAMLGRFSSNARREMESARRSCLAPVLSDEEQFSAFISDPDTFRNFANSHLQKGVVRHLKAFLDTVENPVERFLTANAASGDREGACYFLGAYYGLSGGDPEILKDLSWTPEYMLSLLDDMDKKTVLAWFLEKFLHWSTAEPIRLVELPMMELILEHVDPTELFVNLISRTDFSNTGEEPRVLFSDEALGVLIGADGWINMLAQSVLSDDQFEELLMHTPPEHVAPLFRLLQGSATRLEKLLDVVRNATTIDFDGARMALEALSDPEDLLIGKVMALSNDEVITFYLSGLLNVSGKDLFCAPAKIPAYLKSISDEEHGHAAVLDLVLGRLDRLDAEHLYSLIDHLKGFANRIIEHDTVGSAYVYERLASTGADLAICLEQLDRATNVGLVDLCAMLTNFVKMS